MGLDNTSSDDTVIKEIGARLQQMRLDRNLIRTDLAEQAGVSRSTIERVESGESVQLVNLIRICRALGILTQFEAVFPTPTPSPIEQLKLHGNRRRRASKKRSDAPGTWEWGESE